MIASTRWRSQFGKYRGVFSSLRAGRISVRPRPGIADLDTLLTALCVELTDRIIPSLGLLRPGPGKPPEVTDAERVCLAVARVLLRYDDERHWLRAAASRVGHLFPRLLAQSAYNQRLKNAAPLMEATLRWLADHTPGSAEMLRLMDATPIPCGHSIITARPLTCSVGRARRVLARARPRSDYRRGGRHRIRTGSIRREGTDDARYPGQRRSLR